ncbi:MAG: hypothetical protein IIA14_02270 [SAR324 cluster bacterium]|nr:hypothetical protein [SAR324 cluster bacterium]
MGAQAAEGDEELPGYSLLGMANGEKPERTVFSEYHAANSTTATYLVRRGEFKYVHYVKYRPQLFNLENDPEETEDLAERKEMQPLLAECEATLRTIVDPEAADALAKSDQRAKIERHGGREAIVSRGAFAYTPAPGEEPVYG